ncbi:hypothetical protein PNOK_0334800 [Pyrrhoderma noxium]|uniref:Uncharacterized protein n=1 Tax=Pyrrhoderma noxium TaxID=2282107 RepID=A0A286UM81_9AGAM|nr:hypothetical protein PNOK_0334800 [Pyrrhoderma noxium]
MGDSPSPSVLVQVHNLSCGEYLDYTRLTACPSVELNSTVFKTLKPRPSCLGPVDGILPLEPWSVGTSEESEWV